MGETTWTMKESDSHSISLHSDSVEHCYKEAKPRSSNQAVLELNWLSRLLYVKQQIVSRSVVANYQPFIFCRFPVKV